MRGEVPTIRPVVPTPRGDALAFYIDQGVVATWSQGSTWPWTGNFAVPSGTHTLKWKYYKYSGSTEGSCWIDAIQWQPQVSTASYLQDPLDTDLEVYTGGDSSWSETTSVYYYDNDSAYGGWLDDNKQSQILVNVEGPGTVTFWWKVSSEANYDWLSFYADGVLQDRISGEVGWQQKSYPLGGDGTHALVWVYSKDSSSESGSDRGWVDYLQWTPSGGGGGSSTTDWEQITYTYDPSGRRIAKDVDGEVTKYVYDGDHCIAEYDGDDTLLRKYVHGPCIDEPICMVEAAGGYAGTYYYHFDALGSVVALSDASGDTVQVYEYDVYGQVAASDPNHPNRFLFTGREFDKETGLYYYRARYYNPTIGRFLQTDPIGYADGMNWYAYCGNNATNCVDPSGTVGRFLDSENGMLRYEAGNGEILEFTDLQQWMDWFELDVKSNGYAVSELAGYGMAGGEDNLDTKLLWTIQAMIALGYDEDKIRACDTGGVTIRTNNDHDFGELNMTIDWDPSGDAWTEEERDAYGVENPPHWWVGFPAMALLAHEVEHGYQEVTDQLVNYDDDISVREKAEVNAMMAENAMAYAFYKKVPGYGKGGAYETKGPRTYYHSSGISRVTGRQYEVRKDMTWDDYWPNFLPAY